MIYTTRFAPSPTGPLHLGHAYSACLAHDLARAASGRFFLRMDDIDRSRARGAWAEQIVQDLTWLGLGWDGEIWSQHARAARYREALQQLWDMGLLYPCRCSRADIRAAADAPQEGAPLHGPDGIVYPGTCRAEPSGALTLDLPLRLNMRRALDHVGAQSIGFREGAHHHCHSAAEMCRLIGDPVLTRRDMAAAYHLAIVVDDADQGITHVIRGQDLRDATYIHRVLQELLRYPEPAYHHHRLIRDEAGRRLAKRDDARAIAAFRAEGWTPADLRRHLALPPSSLL